MIKSEEIISLIKSGEGYNVDFKVRVPSKVRELSESVCAYANSEGGYLLIGVNDKGEIKGTDIDNPKRSAIQDSIRDISPALSVEIYSVEVEDKSIWVIDVPQGKDKPYILSGAIYVRESSNTQKLTSAEEIREFFQRANKIFFDAIPCPNVKLEKDLDENNFDTFCLEAGISKSVPSVQILENLQVFNDDGTVKNGGIMFFGKHPELRFPQAVTRCLLFKGTDKVHIIDDKIYGGTLFQQYLQSDAWIKDKLKVAYIIEGSGPRKEIWEIPLEVFKEALINALSHRDYYQQGAMTMVEVYDDRVEISNPGGLLSEVVKDFGRKSVSRNPLIFGLFTRMHLVERVASGIPRMREAMRKAGLPEPRFETEGFFTAIFERPQKQEGVKEGVEGVKEGVNWIGNFSEKSKIVLDLIRSNEGITLGEIAESLGKSPKTIEKYIAVLRGEQIEFRGAPKTGGYYLRRGDNMIP